MTGTNPGSATIAETGVGTLDRAMAILDAVEAGAHRFTRIMDATGLSRGTTHRLIASLERHGFLSRYPGFGYRLGPRLLRLAHEAMRELPLRDVAHPSLERLARVTGETAQLYVRSGDERVCVDAVESRSELRTIVPVGASLPLHAGSAAKVFVAFAPDPGRHVQRAADPARFGRDVGLVRTRGWASSVDERQRGVGSVSAPISGEGDDLLAVVSISGPSSRMSKANAKRYVPAVLEAARRIESALGLPG